METNGTCPTCGSDVIVHEPESDGGTGFFEPLTAIMQNRIAELEEQLATRDIVSLTYEIDLSTVRAENRRMREALKFYADCNNYVTHLTIHEPDYGGPCCDAHRDNGAIARSALGREE